MTRSIIVFPQAKSDILFKAEWLRQSVSNSSADRWSSAIVSRIASLADNAEQWPEADEAAELGRNVRCQLLGRGRHVYRILFTIDDQTVNVLRVRHAAQNSLTDNDF